MAHIPIVLDLASGPASQAGRVESACVRSSAFSLCGLRVSALIVVVFAGLSSVMPCASPNGDSVLVIHSCEHSALPCKRRETSCERTEMRCEHPGTPLQAAGTAMRVMCRGQRAPCTAVHAPGT